MIADAAPAAATAARELLRVRDLRIVAGERTIVSGASLDVRAGETVGIVGESGSGKSMTARALLGLLPRGVRAEGSATLAGGGDLMRRREVARLRGRRISMVFQDPFATLNPAQRCGDQVVESLRDRLSRRERRREAARRLAEVGIDDPTVADRYPFQLSGGMCQRVAIAAALASDPELLIADEPTTALDVTIQAEILALLTSLQASRAMGLVLITHDLRVAFTACHRVYVLYAGRVLEAGPAAALRAAPRHPYTWGLLLAEPDVDRRAGMLRGIPGSVPAPDEVRDACAFAARCDWRRDACVAGRPPLVDHGGAHATACRRYPEIAADLRPRASADGAQPCPALAEAAEPLVRVEGLVKCFATKRGEVRAVDGASLELRAGECAALVGESGSGKTTLARCVAGLERPTAGTVLLPPAPSGGRRGGARPVQMVYQDPRASLHPTRSVGSMLREAVRLRPDGTPPRSRDEVGRLLELVGLPPAYARRSAAGLSGGERQRVAIARALAVEPRILVCDEVVSALDVSVQAQILNLLNDLRARLGMAYLFVTHDLAVVRQVATRVHVMLRGRVVEHGPVEEVLARPAHPYTRRLVAAVPRVGEGAR